MVYIVIAFLFCAVCAAVMLFVADRTLKKGNPNATEPTTVRHRFLAGALRKAVTKQPGG
jgi:hypothetical protein